MTLCKECGTTNPEKNQFCNSCGKALQKPQADAAPVPKKEGPDKKWIIIGIVIAVIIVAGIFFLLTTQSTSTAPVVGKWSIMGDVIEFKGDYSVVQIFKQDNTFRPVGTWKDLGNSRYQLDWETGLKDVLVYNSASQTLVMEVSRVKWIKVDTGSVPGTPAPATSPGTGVHGTIRTGTMTTAAQGSISAAGGTITVNQPGSPINGLKFTAPAGAYPSGQKVTVSSSPITGNTFGSNFNPATPMISINAGNGYADEPILVTIPVTIPQDQFAMAFYYDDATKKLEGIPTASQDSTSITIATRHFSNILVSMISLNSLNGITKVDSGFRPGVDDWEFVNAGSYIAPGGYCAGQSGTMLWYYTEQRQKNSAPSLNGRYDNNGRDKTPLFPMDNTLGIRFASVIQKVTDQQKYWTNSGSIISDVSGSTTFREFKYSMLMTGEPQFVSILREGGGHAIVCYEVSDTTLWVADPNFPGKERMINLNQSTLSPYTSGANSQDIKENGVRIYPRINYIAKSAFFSWPTLAAEYAKVQDGTIGDDQFRSYKIAIYGIKDDGSKKEVSMIPAGGKNPELKQVTVEEKTVQLMVVNPATGAIFYNQNGKTVQNPIALNEGSNIIAVEGLRRDVNQKWYGFDWIDIVYKPATSAVPSAGHYTAHVYRILPSRANDQDCNAYSFFADAPLCDTDNWEGMSLRCGKPPEKCIDNSWNGGIVEELSFISTQNGNKVRRILDGDRLFFDKNGLATDRSTWKNGEEIERCCYWSKTDFECHHPGDPEWKVWGTGYNVCNKQTI
ncbi:MAG: zinc ribbon domain-containing protein [Methanoregula sp.]|nr:zinc ribbon domain-containing protein [Methanoregula sp.]